MLHGETNDMTSSVEIVDGQEHAIALQQDLSRSPDPTWKTGSETEPPAKRIKLEPDNDIDSIANAITAPLLPELESTTTAKQEDEVRLLLESNEDDARFNELQLAVSTENNALGETQTLEEIFGSTDPIKSETHASLETEVSESTHNAVLNTEITMLEPTPSETSNLHDELSRIAPESLGSTQGTSSNTVPPAEKLTTDAVVPSSLPIGPGSVEPTVTQSLLSLGNPTPSAFQSAPTAFLPKPNNFSNAEPSISLSVNAASKEVSNITTPVITANSVPPFSAPNNGILGPAAALLTTPSLGTPSGNLTLGFNPSTAALQNTNAFPNRVSINSTPLPTSGLAGHTSLSQVTTIPAAPKSPALPTPKISRLVILYDTPKFQHMKTQVEDFKAFPHSSLKIILLNELEVFEKDKYDWLNLCIEYNDEFSGNLKKISEFIEKNNEYVKTFKEVGFHIQFDPRKKWPNDYTEFERDEYATFINTLKAHVADKVVHCSIINKFEINTIYLTNKDDLEKLGHEIQADIDLWKNLRYFDYGDNCIRFFPGVKFPETIELMNIGGGYALETLAGFKMPPKLKVLIASNGSISSIDNISFPPTLETLELVENKLYFLSHVEFPPRLEKLDLSNNRIDNLRGIEFPKNLKQLSLSMNPIDSIKGIKFPNSLEYLDISCVPNESMTGVKFPDSLITLNLQESMTTTRGLKLPQFLKEVNLGDNGVNSINPLKLPDSIEKLWLNNNNIKTLNKVQFPPTLKELYLGNNMITTLKNVLFPRSLELLDLEMDPTIDEHDKHLTTLKDVVFPANLKHLSLGYHSIKSVESIEFPYSLETLSLRYNELKVFRNNKFGPHLKQLDLSGNQDLVSLDHVLLPDSLIDLRVHSLLVDKLPGYIIERANAKKLVITKSAPY